MDPKQNIIKKNRLKLAHTEIESDDDYEYEEVRPRKKKIRKKSNHQKRQIIIAVSVFAVCLIALIVITVIYKQPGSFLDSTRNETGGTLPQKGSDSLFGENVFSKELPQDEVSDNIALERAKSYYMKGDISSAVAEFSEVTASDASDKDKATAYAYLGIIEDEKGNFNAALNFYKKALKYDKNNIFVLKSIAASYKNQGNFSEAEDYIDKAISNDSKNSDLYVMKGNILYLQKKFTDAIKAYQEAVLIKDDNPSALYNLAQSYMKTGNEVRAEEYYLRAATADNDGRISSLSYSNLGGLYLKNNDYPQAAKYLERAIKLAPNDSSNYYNLGIAYLKMGKKDDAIAQFQIAETKGNDDAVLLENLGDAYSSLKEYEKSIDVYNRLLSINERNVTILLKLGELYYSSGYINESLQYFQKITVLQPLSEYSRIAFINIGNIYDDMERYEEAVEAYQSAVAIKPDDPTALYNLGIVYKHMGQNEKAINTWKESLKSNSENPKPQIAMADLLYDEGYLDEALNEYSKISEKWSNISEPHFAIATIYNRRGETDFAEKRYKKVLELNNNDELIMKSYINLAAISLSRKNEEADKNAFNYIQKALVKEPGNPEALLTLGNIYYERGSFNNAIETYYQVIKSTNSNSITATAYNNMGKAYYKMKQYKKAVQTFNLGIEQDPTNEDIRLNRKAAVDSYESEMLN
ncbi:MAG: tetratricopeptide repeat protein [Spirochaetes bacterium]|nr:tetratricopeptide repeat protein [Spirochaetota bacterium]